MVSLLYAAVTVVVPGLALAALRIERRRRRPAEPPPGPPPALPRALYPVVDPDRCIGSRSCLKACPEGKVLSFRDGVPLLLHPDKCVGHGACAEECPVDAIRLVLGSREASVLLPRLRAGFESSRAGIHVVGELAGAPLLEPSMKQGLEVGAHIAAQLKVERARARTDVAIVGAGPAGLAAAFALGEVGVTYRVLERGRALSTIHAYPAGKLVTTRELRLPGVGVLAKGRVSREQLLARCASALEHGRIRVEEHTEVLAIDGDDGNFTLRTSAGPVRARKVVLATGRSGTPRRLGVPGEDLPKVSRRLADPSAHAGRRALVVGGGDTAVEAAIALARAGAQEVVLCHRDDALRRCGSANRVELERLASEGLVRVALRARVTRIAERSVELSTPGGELTLPNDAVIVAIGGDLPLRLLERAGVALRRYEGEDPKASSSQGERPGGGWRGAALGIAALLAPAALFFLATEAWDYYRLHLPVRLRSPLHPHLRSSSPFGMGMGIASAALMAIALAYSIRKRSRRFLGFGNIRAWLGAHAAAGLLCLLTVVVHAAFSTKHALASATLASLFALVVTGAVGRWVYGRLEAAPARPIASCARAAASSLVPDGSGGIALAAASPGSAAIKAALGAWRPLHLALATFVALAVAAHVAVDLLIGYAFH